MLTWVVVPPVISLGAVVISILLGLSALAGIFYAARRREDIVGLQNALTASAAAGAAWKDERDAALAAAERARQDLTKERDEQREIRHGLKNDLAACRAELEIERKKHDLTAIVEQMAATQTSLLEAMSESQAAAVDTITETIRLSNDWQKDIFDRLANGQEALIKALESRRTNHGADAPPAK